ncbi:MAG TPA: hypothetical protein VL614_18290 [Acetobacteraceae bacterium]|nr:hypothetical protein [Acetobacteraceae bacterium]
MLNRRDSLALSRDLGLDVGEHLIGGLLLLLQRLNLTCDLDELLVRRVTAKRHDHAENARRHADCSKGGEEASDSHSLCARGVGLHQEVVGAFRRRHGDGDQILQILLIGDFGIGSQCRRKTVVLPDRWRPCIIEPEEVGRCSGAPYKREVVQRILEDNLRNRIDRRSNDVVWLRTGHLPHSDRPVGRRAWQYRSVATPDVSSVQESGRRISSTSNHV